MNEDTPLFEGLRVVEVASMFMAPMAGTILADYGADVIKVEPPQGDNLRILHTLKGMPESEIEYCNLLVNRNKRGMALDLKQPAAADALRKLIETADVFITNYRPEAQKRLRITYDDVKDINPRLVYAYGSGYGETGPDVNQPGYDHICYWTRSGLESSIFPLDGWLGTWTPAMGDNPTGVTLFSAILAALYRRERTGKGGRVSTSLLANGAWSNSCLIQAQLTGANFLERRTRADAYNYVALHYRTSDDRMIKLCIVEQVRDWPKLCAALNKTEWTTDPRFDTLEVRQTNIAELIRELDARFAQEDRAHWLDRLNEHDIPHSMVAGYDDVAQDPQMEAIGVFADYEHPKHGTMRTVNNPLNINEESKQVRFPAPGLGQHTTEILASLGYNNDTIASMVDSGAAVQADIDANVERTQT